MIGGVEVHGYKIIAVKSQLNCLRHQRQIKAEKHQFYQRIMTKLDFLGEISLRAIDKLSMNKKFRQIPLKATQFGPRYQRITARLFLKLLQSYFWSPIMTYFHDYHLDAILNYMSSKYQTTATEVFTNSCIEVTVPKQYQALGRIVFEWYSSHQGRHRNSTQHLIHPVNQNSHKTNSNVYLCSPLNYGCIVIARMVLVDQKQRHILQQLRYGPIKVEQKVVDFMAKTDATSIVSFIFDKNCAKQGEIKVLRSLSRQPTKPNNRTIKLLIRIDQQIAVFKISSATHASSDKQVVKFYPDELCCLGLLIQEQPAEFKAILKELNIQFCLNSYIKIVFASRIARDAFILQIMRQCGEYICEIQPLFCQPTFEEPGIDELSEEERTEGLADNQQLLNQSLTLKDNIISDFENILFSPQSSIKRDDEPLLQNELEQQFLTSTAVQQNSAPKDSPVAKVHQSRQSKSQWGSNQSQSTKTVKQISLDYQKEEKPEQGETKKFKAGLIPESIQISAGTFEGLLEKINKLMSINEDLAAENNLLKEQNLRIRFENLKNSKPENQKIMEVREMMQKMQRRLQNLEKERLLGKKKDEDNGKTTNWLMKKFEQNRNKLKISRSGIDQQRSSGIRKSLMGKKILAQQHPEQSETQNGLTKARSIQSFYGQKQIKKGYKLETDAQYLHINVKSPRNMNQGVNVKRQRKQSAMLKVNHQLVPSPNDKQCISLVQSLNFEAHNRTEARGQQRIASPFRKQSPLHRI